jgi:hypothetical protein
LVQNIRQVTQLNEEHAYPNTLVMKLYDLESSPKSLSLVLDRPHYLSYNSSFLKDRRSNFANVGERR